MNFQVQKQIKRTIIFASFFFFALAVRFAGADANNCLIWTDPAESICPQDYEPTKSRGKNILNIGKLIKENGVERKGNCWSFVKAVYDCAGYSTKQVFPLNKKSDKKGPYLKEINMLRPGDWVLHINKEYHRRERIEHSAIFVRWIDKEKKKAYMLDYVGNDQCVPPGYKVHALSEVYSVLRAVPKRLPPVLKPVLGQPGEQRSSQ